jgi:MFS family permease
MRVIKNWLLGLVNVYEEEFSEVFVMWFLSFVYRLCMVLGWTVMVAFFVGEYGVKFLPVLFALHAFSNILGSLFFGKIISRFEKSSLSLYLAILISFLFAVTAFVYTVSPEVFLLACLVSVSLFLSQFKIVRSLFAESIFSPTQAARVFPVIESAETFGVLIGGSLVAFLSLMFPIHKIFLVMVVCMLLCVPTILFYLDKSMLVPYRKLFSVPEKGVLIEEDKDLDWGLIVDQFKNNRFVSYLFMIVLFQFIFFGILEFHFTFVVEEFSKSYHHSGGIESNLAADLGLIHAVFAAVVLFMQLFVTSRLLKYMGAISTMLISPIVMIVSTVGMLFGFSFPSVLIARFNQEVTHVLHYNAYHTSYYALSHKFRTAVIELMEGVVRPLGTIVAMVVLFCMNYFLPNQFTMYSNIFSLFVLFGIIVLTKKFGKEFDNKPIRSLQMSNSLVEQMTAIEILESVSDKELNVKMVKDLLKHRADLRGIVKGRLYKYIGEHGETEDVFFLIERYEFEDCKVEILEAINSLFHAKIKGFGENVFTLEFMYQFYDKLVDEEVDGENYAELIVFLSLFYVQSGNVRAIVTLCDNILNENNCLCFVEALSENTDPGMYLLFKKYLEYDSSKVRMAFLTLLDDYMPKDKIKSLVRSCLVSSDEMSVVYGLIYILIAKEYDLLNFYDGLIKEKSVESERIEMYYRLIHELANEGEGMVEYLRSKSIGLVDEAVALLKDWSADDELISILMKRYEIEVYSIYDELMLDLGADEKLEKLYVLKNCYKNLGANREYFMLKDLLS